MKTLALIVYVTVPTFLFTQAMARVHRIGQTKADAQYLVHPHARMCMNVLVYTLYTRGAGMPAVLCIRI